MTRTQFILKNLPATLGELAALCETDKHSINGILNWLSLKGRVKRSNRYGMRDGVRGPRPALWVRI